MKRPLLTILLCFFCLPILAQQRWGGGVDYEKIHFGFSFHYVSSSFKVFKSDKWKEPYSPDPSVPRSLTGITSPLNYGVGLGVLSDLSLGENSDLRFSPTIVFSGNFIDYSYSDPINVISGDNEIFSKKVNASLLELPLTFKFKSDRSENYRIYLLGGGKYSLNIVPRKGGDDSSLPEKEKQVKLKRDFLSYEFGLGFDIYFEYFKMSPEIKWSQSIGNVMNKTDVNAFNTPIDKLLLRSVQFSLIFE